MIQTLRPLWPLVAILAAAVLVDWSDFRLPPSLAGLRSLGAYLLLIAAAALSVWFNRERAFVLSVSMFAGFAAVDYLHDAVTYAAVSTLVPFNAIIALGVNERGARFGRAWRWMALLGFEIALIYFLQRESHAEEMLEHWMLSPPPLIARLAFAGAFALAVKRAWPNHTPLELGVAGALVAFFIACGWIDSPKEFALFNAAAAAMLVVAVLQESHRMAFRDALTGLPNRRALEDQLRALTEPYTIAMVDVDHFKKFNDSYGHDIGDQVLKLVAARLAEVGGGGRAFRYGGEEFTVLFRHKPLVDVLPHLENSRISVQGYKMAVRGQDRPKDTKEGSKRRVAVAPVDKQDFSRTDLILSVTVSIGAAEPSRRLKTAQEVVKGADEALYRAKERGRNRVSR